MPDTATIIISAAATLGCAAFARLFLGACFAGDHRRAFRVKGLAGLCFVAVGLLMALRCGKLSFAVPVAAGLVLGLAGDQLLALRFILKEKHDLMFVSGAVAFSMGHVLYILALLRLTGGMRPAALIALWLAGAAAAVVYARIRRTNAGKLNGGCCVYIALVTLMCAVACAAAIKAPGAATLMFAAGGVCFVVSDNVLTAYCFGNRKTPGMNRTIHITYYLPQLLIAWSLAFV